MKYDFECRLSLHCLGYHAIGLYLALLSSRNQLILLDQ